MHEDEPDFTGERLHANDPLFGIDLLRHRAAYREAIRRATRRGAQRVLELGSGTGYGAAELAAAGLRVVAVDRVAPLASARRSTAAFVRGDLGASPIRHAGFDLVVSFQVIEHLDDPAPYLDTLAGSLDDSGEALVSTPNALFSDGENPFHVHEYTAAELEHLLRSRFDEVEMLAVSARGEALAYHEARLARIRRIVRLDPFRLRRLLPSTIVAPLFAGLARLVRRGLHADRTAPRIELDDFPVEPAHARCLDLLALCRGPRRVD
jgi:SAM-dependent methyltransferase